MGTSVTDVSELIGSYPVCAACGSRDVVRDAWAEWDIEAQDWSLRSLFDTYSCEGCGADITPDWKLDDAMRRTRIRTINDALRRGCFDNASIMVTSGVQERGSGFVESAANLVAGYKDFDPDNDPHGGHDFGSFEIDGEKLFWKIDYYDRSLKKHSPDAANPLVTHRVLTIMLASEY
jgi:uncharacterized protein DUF3768